jgi:hypothetical protein
VRSLVGIITTIATVIHFTFGCCLHPCHFGGCSETVPHAVESAACDACCHDHDDAASAYDTLPCGHIEDVRAEVHAEGGRASMSVADHCLGCDGCQGCHCVATSTETGATVSWSPLASGIVAALDSDAIVLFAGAGGRRPPDPHLHPRPGRHPLFERFLI